jgi:hypothetical protein
MQPVVERCPDGEDATARTCPGFQDDDRCTGLVEKISGAQAGETGADDDDGLVGFERTRGDASNDGRGERKRARRLLKKSSPIHGVLTLLGRRGRRIGHVTFGSKDPVGARILQRGAALPRQEWRYHAAFSWATKK